jgi:hypothetical protein
VFYAKPLVYTPPGSAHESVITASNQNNIRVLGGVTGTLAKSRALAPPFQAVDSSSGDIPNAIEIAGTPIIVSAPMANFGVNPTSGVIYVMNVDNLGRFKNGSSVKIPQCLYRC